MLLDRHNRIRAVFFLHAISSGGLYSHVADVQNALHIDAQTLGLVFLGFPIGSMLVFLFGSQVLEAVGSKPILATCIPSLPLSRRWGTHASNSWLAPRPGKDALTNGRAGAVDRRRASRH